MKTIICMRVTNSVHVIQGSRRRWCVKCNEAVFVSPASLQIAGEGPSQIFCLECFNTSTEDLGELQPINPEQIREVRDHFSKLN